MNILAMLIYGAIYVIFFTIAFLGTIFALFRIQEWLEERRTIAEIKAIMEADVDGEYSRVLWDENQKPKYIRYPVDHTDIEILYPDGFKEDVSLEEIEARIKKLTDKYMSDSIAPWKKW